MAAWRVDVEVQVTVTQVAKAAHLCAQRAHLVRARVRVRVPADDGHLEAVHRDGVGRADLVRLRVRLRVTA